MSGVAKIVFGFMLAWCIVQFIFGERVPVNGGFGWDGIVYGTVAQNFPDTILNRTLPPNYAERVLPSGIVFVMLSFLGVALNHANVIAGFFLMNSVCILSAVILWDRILKPLDLTTGQRGLAFVALFGNFFILKQVFYNPVITDSLAFLLSLSMLFAFINNRPWLLLVISFVSAFTWPLAVYIGLLLFLFPCRADWNKNIVEGGGPLRSLAIWIAVGYCGFSLILLNTIDTHFDYEVAPVQFRLLPLTVLGLAFYVYWGLAGILDRIRLERIPGELKVLRIAPALVVLLAVWTILNVIGDAELPQTNHLPILIYLTLVKPLLFLLARILYFGPVVILGVLFWRRISKVIPSLGLGFSAFAILSVLMSIDPESRHSLHFFPFFVFLIVHVFKEVQLDRRFFWIYCGLSLFLSKAWMPINIEPLRGSLLEFPMQYYCMTHGPWMSDAMYVLQGTVVLGLIAYFCVYFRGRLEEGTHAA